MGKAGPGIRNTKKKKYLSGKDMIYAAIAVVVLAAVITAICLIVNRDDFIRVVDGKLDIGINWLVADYSDTNYPRYYKIGEIGDVEGYAISDSSQYSVTKLFTPIDEESDIQLAYAGAYKADYTTMADNAMSISGDKATARDITVLDRSAKCLTSMSYLEKAEDAEAETETGTDAEGVWVCIVYIDYDAEHCVYLQFTGTKDLDEAQTDALIAQFADAVTLTDPR